MSMKNSNDTIGKRTRDLPACSTVPQTTALPRAHVENWNKYIREKELCVKLVIYKKCTKKLFKRSYLQEVIYKKCIKKLFKRSYFQEVHQEVIYKKLFTRSAPRSYLQEVHQDARPTKLKKEVRIATLKLYKKQYVLDSWKGHSEIDVNT
jgi:K+ transporter